MDIQSFSINFKIFKLGAQIELNDRIGIYTAFLKILIIGTYNIQFIDWSSIRRNYQLYQVIISSNR